MASTLYVNRSVSVSETKSGFHNLTLVGRRNRAAIGTAWRHGLAPGCAHAAMEPNRRVKTVVTVAWVDHADPGEDVRIPLTGPFLSRPGREVEGPDLTP